MSKKTRLVPERKVTKRQLSRWQREARLQKLLVAAAAVVLVLVIAIPAFGYYREVYSVAHATVLQVNDKKYDMDYYAKRVYFGLYMLDLQEAQVGSQADPSSPWTNARTSLPIQLLDDLTNEELVREGATKMGISVTPDEVTQDMKDKLLPPVSPDQQVDQAQRDAQFQNTLNSLLKNGRLSEAEFRSIVENGLLQQKITDQLQSQVVTTTEQVHARGILFSTEDEAKAAYDQLQQGADFAALADEQAKKDQPPPTPTPTPSPTASPSDPTPAPVAGPPADATPTPSPTPTAPDQNTQPPQPVLNGGDLGWFPRGLKSPDFDQVVFKLQVGEISQPFQTPEGYWVVKLEERSDAKDMDEQTIQAVKDNAFQYWLTQQQDSAKVERHFDSGKYSWVMDRVNQERQKYLKAPAVPGY